MKAKELIELLQNKKDFDITVSLDISNNDFDSDRRIFGININEVVSEYTKNRVTICMDGEFNYPNINYSINRLWAMPNKNTFTIKPIKEIVEKYVNISDVIIDPFANESSYGTITNDLNPEFNTDYHLDALSFLKQIESNSADLVLFDPPYSITQAAQCYKDYGKEKLERNVANMGYWADCKNEVARILKTNGIALICGWNSNGIGKNRGFEMVEILLVPHGGSKNDTIVTVEFKR